MRKGVNVGNSQNFFHKKISVSGEKDKGNTRLREVLSKGNQKKVFGGGTYGTKVRRWNSNSADGAEKGSASGKGRSDS